MEQSILLRVRVQPRSSKDEVVGWKEGVLYLRLRVPPVGGLANRACVNFLAERLGMKRSNIHLVSGEKSRNKVFRVEGLSWEEASRRIGEGR